MGKPASIAIYDRIGFEDLLGALGKRGERTWWRPKTTVSYVSEEDRPIQALEPDNAGGPWTTTPQFAELHSSLYQIIDGVLEGVEGSLPPVPEFSVWITLRAVDSSWWEVYTDDAFVHDELHRRFLDLRAAQYSPDYPATDYGG